MTIRETSDSLRNSPWFSLGILSYNIDSPTQKHAHDVISAALTERDELLKKIAGHGCNCGVCP